MITIDHSKLDHRQAYALYIHIPFCHYRCHYCDFFAAAKIDPKIQQQVVARIEQEVTKQTAALGIQKVSSVYIGGGTPSIIAPEQLRSLIDRLQAYQPQQLTVELNPEDVSHELLCALELERWSNLRLSMGMQTFHQPSLDAVGRQVRLEQMQQALELLADYKDRLSLDLIVGLPYHRKELVLADVQRVLAYHPSHFSLYALAMEEGTLLTYCKHPALPSSELRQEQWEVARDALLQGGYYQYEVSNYSLAKEYESVQNKHYWQLLPYVGIGPGAVGTLVLQGGKAVRVTGVKSFKAWMDESQSELWEYEMIEAKEFLFEHYMMGLRTRYGVSKALLMERFGEQGLMPWHELRNSRWTQYMQEDASYVWLNDEGRLFLDGFLLEVLVCLDGDK